jgi:hypothetical protein
MTCRSVLGWAAVAVAASAAEPDSREALVTAAAAFTRQGKLAQALSDPASAAAAVVSSAHCHYTLARHFLYDLLLIQQRICTARKATFAAASPTAVDCARLAADSDSSRSDDDDADSANDSESDSDVSVLQEQRQPSAAQGSSTQELRNSAQSHADAAKDRLAVWLQYGSVHGDTPAQIHAHLCLAQVAALQVQLNETAGGSSSTAAASSSNSRGLASSLQSSVKGLAAVAAAATAVSALQRHTTAALALCADSGAVLLQGAVQACIDAL